MINCGTQNYIKIEQKLKKLSVNIKLPRLMKNETQYWKQHHMPYEHLQHTCGSEGPVMQVICMNTILLPGEYKYIPVV
jgi:hypothetical protein